MVSLHNYREHCNGKSHHEQLNRNKNHFNRNKKPYYHSNSRWIPYNIDWLQYPSRVVEHIEISQVFSSVFKL